MRGPLILSLANTGINAAGR